MTLYVIGVGPGDPDLITVKGLEILKNSEVVTGWGSVIERFSSYIQSKRIIRLNYKEEEKQLNEIMKLAKDENVAFLNHGDPAVSDFQLLNKLKKLCVENRVELVIIPGVSSIIRALHIIGKDLSEIVFLTFHVRGEINYDEIKKFLNTGRGILINPEPYPDGVKRIALKLREYGCNSITLTIMEKLTYQDEKVYNFNVDEIITRDLKFSDLTIVYIPPCSFS
ncbi:cobalt-precorrin-7 (C(5))-methyltransferase [Sulfurisphaera ohwakuensis]|uniref:Cobalt-precorrin-7 (C(5))-methyltransferase n=1 Tax=Sulfurisphaera ohwakuensis TaxID=69656 RepID=A0A650CIN6_SULOH|nr:cobalt-precorrin-7 (C(5))-methyltransferase [Sulfurisphaera ohwakuensis]MBB5253789.1 cobalt-precorrin-7 (C5)-methyltransferase [Sulfurisphaera ohwakuensis]QGR17535.1 cobalt-precorrin-7 (C(5))-methyltransferase [Sulfurisphaera ohwakuensis]